MRLLCKLQLPTPAENAVAGEPGFVEKLNGLLNELGTQAIFSRRSEKRRIVYALFDVENPARILAIAEPISTWLKIKVEFFSETVGKSHFGGVTPPSKSPKAGS
jgi:hypothetical protein